MKTTFNEKLIAYLTLLSGLSISAVAVYYSVVGLTTIFAAAVIPIVIMGIVLEVSKLIATVWLKQNWNIAPKSIKLYLTISVIMLMFITSLGIFGFLSKAHSDQSLVSGEVLSKIAIYDEKIKTAKENIEADRRQLKQMDEAVDQVMARSTTEQGADKSVAIRKAQARDRSALAKNIATNQKLIATLNDEAAPIRAEVRKVEAEVGPLKYIAAFIYGETDKTILEKAVTWVIIIIVLVFDPLAVILLLASQISFQNFRDREDNHIDSYVADVGEKPTAEELAEIATEDQDSETIILESKFDEDYIEETPNDSFNLNDHPYLNQAFKYPEGWKFEPPMVYTPQESTEGNSPEKESDVVSTATVTEQPLFVQNEEQTESSLWTSTNVVVQNDPIINEIDYRNISKEKLEERINYYAGLLRERRINAVEIPKEIIQEVKARV